MLHEVNSNGHIDYIYLNGRPLAMLQQDQLYYIHTDHLGTPRAVSDSRGKAMWVWNSDPFGQTPAVVVGKGRYAADFAFNLRFPGQYYDEETGLHYNYFRYYDPATGRYITSDPIGLQGGLNTYGYVSGNPIYYFDADGLHPIPNGNNMHPGMSYGTPHTNCIGGHRHGRDGNNRIGTEVCNQPDAARPVYDSSNDKCTHCADETIADQLMSSYGEAYVELIGGYRVVVTGAKMCKALSKVDPKKLCKNSGMATLGIMSIVCTDSRGNDAADDFLDALRRRTQIEQGSGHAQPRSVPTEVVPKK